MHKVQTQVELFVNLLAISKVPEPAISACDSNIAFYGNITMVYGEAKLGKSFTVASAIKGSNALFIDIDNNGLELHEHLLANKVLPLHGFEAMPFLNIIANHNGDKPFIIVIDSFANFADELNLNINDTRDITKLFKFVRMFTDNGHAVVLVHHVTTNGKERGSKDYSAKIQGNAGAIFGRVDVTYLLKDRGCLVINRSRISNAAEQFISEDAPMTVKLARGNNAKIELPA